MQKIMQNNRIKVAAAILFVVVVLVCYVLLRGSAGRAPAGTTSIVAAKIYAPSDEIFNLTLVYPNATLSTFSCNYNSDCVGVHTKPCFNNLASQQACISKTYADTYESYYRKFLTNDSIACPMYFVVNNASCACINHGCSLVYR